MLHVFFWIVFVGGGVSAFFNNSGIWVAIAGGIAPMIAWFGGSGTRGSFYATTPQKVVGIILGMIFLGGAMLWVEAVGFRVILNWAGGIEISGWQWVLFAYAVGLIFTSKKFAPGGSEDVIGRHNRPEE